jgi:hypothetical protein
MGVVLWLQGDQLQALGGLKHDESTNVGCSDAEIYPAFTSVSMVGVLNWAWGKRSMAIVTMGTQGQPLRGTLRKRDRMEMLQDSYLQAVAAAAGCTMAKPNPDDGIDWELTHSSESHTVDCQINLKVQLKSTWTSAPNPPRGSVSVKLKNKRLEQLAHTPVMVHRILVAMIVPEDVAKWVEATHDYFALRHCAYWESYMG